MSPEITTLQALTYLGGDSVSGIAVAPDGTVFISDGFVAKYSLDLQDRLALTYLGGSDAESCRSIALDASGDVFVAGETISPDFPTSLR